MSYQITDEQIDEATKDIGLQSPFARYRIARAVLALAEPAPHGAIDLLSEFSEAMSDSGDWPDTYDERTRLKSLVDRVRFYLKPAEQWATVPKGGEEWSTVPKGYTELAPAVPSDVLSEMREFGNARMAEFMGAHHMALVLSQKINEWADKLTAAPTPPAQAKCLTCNGHGLIGGHMQDGSGYSEGCQDCNPEPAVPEDVARTLICPKCNADRFKGDCKGDRHTCPVRGEAWSQPPKED